MRKFGVSLGIVNFKADAPGNNKLSFRAKIMRRGSKRADIG